MIRFCRRVENQKSEITGNPGKTLMAPGPVYPVEEQPEEWKLRGKGDTVVNF